MATEPPTYDNCDHVSDRCPVEFTIFGDYLSAGASIFFGATFAILLLAQVIFGIRGRMWSFTIWLSIGTLFEVLGYLSRFSLSRNPWGVNPFLLQYLTLLLAPTLMAAAISITFKHLVLWFGPEWSLIRPRLYPWVFVGTDFISIFIQIIGGGASAASTTGNGSEAARKLGEVLVIGGVVFQVINMICCATLMLMYSSRRKAALRNGPIEMAGQDRHEPSRYSKVPQSRSEANPSEARKVHLFIYALALAYGMIIARCIYRIFETAPATSAKVIRNEALFYVFDGVPILLAVCAITIFHPCIFFPYLGKRNKE